jgi:hypothetical protein
MTKSFEMANRISKSEVFLWWTGASLFHHKNTSDLKAMQSIALALHNKPQLSLWLIV